eukprot:1639756-Ditylum_brightwellii.AAC.1
MFVKDKIKETIKERDCDMHAMSNFKDLSISSSNDSIKSIVSNTSYEESDSDSHKPAHKSEVMGKNKQGIILRIIRL